MNNFMKNFTEDYTIEDLRKEVMERISNDDCGWTDRSGRESIFYYMTGNERFAKRMLLEEIGFEGFSKLVDEVIEELKANEEW